MLILGLKVRLKIGVFIGIIVEDDGDVVPYSRLSCLIMGLMWSNQTCGEETHRSGLRELIFDLIPRLFFSSNISPLSFDGSGTPGQSSPPRRGSCGSTPGPTTPCPGLFAAKGGRTVSKHSGRGDSCLSISIRFTATRTDRHSHLNFRRPG